MRVHKKVSSLRVVILGSSGLLGARLNAELQIHGFQVFNSHSEGVSNSRVDLRDWQQTSEFLSRVSPDVIVNLVALTDVEKCEKDPNSAYVLNVMTVENVVRWIREIQKNSHLIHISTDQVYDGSGPHLESNVTLKNYYAFSKYAAEKVAEQVGSTIFRTNFFGKSITPGRYSFTDWLYKSLKSNTSVPVFSDIRFSPISIKTLINHIIQAFDKSWEGVFNVGSMNGMSKAEFAYMFAKCVEADTSLLRIIRSEQTSIFSAYRPKDMTMNVNFFEKISGFSPQTLLQEIEFTAEEYCS